MEVNEVSQQPKLQKWIRVHEVIALTSLSRPTIYRLMKAGKFPKSVTIGSKTVAWRESDLLAWQASKEPEQAGQQ